MKATKRKLRTTELNMTPMIDCVFLLLTFFMVVTDIARQDDIEDIKLPDVKAAKPDDNPDPKRLVINMKWEREPKGVSFWFGGGERTEQDVRDALAVEARMSRDPAGISDRVVLVKADKRVKFEYIKRLMMMCVDKNIRIWRLAFGTLPQQSDEAAPAGSGT